MVNVNFSMPPVFGYETERCNANGIHKRNKSHDLKAMLSATKIIGYFPLVSTIAGLFRLILTTKADNSVSNGFKARMYTRAIMEILNLGPLLAITDLFITLHRL